MSDETELRQRVVLQDTVEEKVTQNRDGEFDVDIKEKTVYEDQNGQIVQETKETHWHVLEFEHLPEWLQDNEYLKSGHRPIVENYFDCFRSIFKLHSETGNIWSHLIGALIFIGIAAYWFATSDTFRHVTFHDKVVFLTYFTCAILCLFLSALFHTMCCHSKEVFRLYRKLDYLGISLMIVGSVIPQVYYWFYCHTVPKVIYISMIVILGLAVIYMSFSPTFSHNQKHALRAMIFAAMSLTVLVPATHYVLTHGTHRLHLDRFDLFLLMGCMYICGGILYATRIPERFFPGKCDIWMQSHQLFHLLVVFGAITHYVHAYEMASHRLTGNIRCSNSTM